MSLLSTGGSGFDHWLQVNYIDMSTPKLLAETDSRMLQEMSTTKYFKSIFMTFGGKGTGDRVRKQ